MELTDGSITLRRPTEADAPAISANVQHSLAELSPWMPWATADYNEADALSWIRGELDPNADQFVILDGEGALVGTCGLNQINAVNKMANLGYWLRSDCCGNGWASSATTLAARYAFQELGLHRVEIFMSTANEASRRVAERVGAKYEGVLRGRLLLHGVHHDVHMFALLATDAHDRPRIR